MKQPQIERYHGEATGHPALWAIGRSVQTEARPGFRPHRHSCMEICLVLGGSIGYFTEEASYVLEADSVHVNQPGQAHGTSGRFLQPCTLAWMLLEPAALLESALEGPLSGIPRRLATGAGRLYPRFMDMLREVRGGRADRTTVLSGHLRLFLADLVRLSEGAGPLRRPAVLRRALARLEDPEADPDGLSITALARDLGVHRSHLHRMFVEHLGVPPKTYAQQCRLHRASARLRNSRLRVTDIAYDFGFSSSQHFATAFRKQYGLTPTAFRRSVLPASLDR